MKQGSPERANDDEEDDFERADEEYEKTKVKNRYQVYDGNEEDEEEKELKANETLNQNFMEGEKEE